jgi:ribosomal protein S18 acetylase RimI-like enzyme
MLRMVDLRRSKYLWEAVANLYCQVFREHPWREDLSPEQALETMSQQFRRPNAIALALSKGRETIGFTWAYEIIKGNLRQGTRFSPELAFLFDDSQRVFYLQELGVREDSRRQGHGEELVRVLLRRVKERGADVVVLSTNCKATAIVRLIEKLGFENTFMVRPPIYLGRTYWTLYLN